jgi:DNA-binding transcriptional LysR family regulator
LQGDSRETLERLTRGEIEIGIIGTLFDEGEVEFRPLGQDRIVLVVKADHPWANRNSVRLNELLNERYIIREAGSGTEKTVREALAKSGVENSLIKVQASLGSNEAVKQAVAAGIGAAFISEMSIRREVAQRDVSKVKIKGLTITRRFYLITRKRRDVSPPARAFADLLLDMYASPP